MLFTWTTMTLAMKPRGNVMMVPDNAVVADNNGIACLGIE